MGSGISGSYSGTILKSQSYASSYSVTPDLLENDKKDPDIYDSNDGYFKNPSATNLEESIMGDSVYIDGKKAHGIMTYVMDEKGNIIFGKRINPNNPQKRAPHPTLIGGVDPKVQCAGMITFSKGKIVAVDNKSGHYKPNIKSLDAVDSAIEKIGKKYPNVLNNKSKWRK